MSYIELPLETSSDDLAADAIDYLMAAIPGFVPQEGHLEIWLIEAFARMQAETRDVASRVAPSIFRYFGKSLLGIPAVDAARASAKSTWTAIDNTGYVVEAGTLVAFNPTGLAPVYFEVLDDVPIAAGSTSTSVGEVTLVAVDAGEAANGLAAGAITLVDALSWVNTVTTTQMTSGGVDAEPDTDYLNRLADELRLLSPRPILPNDFSVLARRIAGVDRATTIDGYNPANATFNNERMVAVAVVDEDGNAVTTPIKNQVQAYLDALREVNFVVNVINPSYTTVNVTAAVKKFASADAATVEAATEAALQSYLSPVNWDWTGTVRRFELVALLSNVPGVDYVVSITTPASDVVLSGVATLPTAGAIAVTVS